ncbi:MAG TPA: acyl-CoA reductase [Chitinophagaceae bacterium]|nr:acyl-CoA reductase [Chitinophagaceae bacterium]
MNLQDRIKILGWLRNYLTQCPESLQDAKENAAYQNSWFTPEFINMSIANIREQFLAPGVLEDVATRYHLPEQQDPAKTVGLVMAGNIPLVGFHDFLCVFLAGHKQVIKPSSRDNVLLRHLVEQICAENPEVADVVSFSENLKGLDAYIATGSNNSARYFEQYFAKFPHVIRKNRTGIAILDGTETEAELEKLANDIQQYFGLGCRNVTQVWVPEHYDFTPLLGALEQYDYFMDNHKYKHNYDYVLTINMMNREKYYTNGSIVISPGTSPYASISNLKYARYMAVDDVVSTLNPDEIQVICGHGFTPFGQAQCPGFYDYADGVDTMAFLITL